MFHLLHPKRKRREEENDQKIKKGEVGIGGWHFGEF